MDEACVRIFNPVMVKIWGMLVKWIIPQTLDISVMASWSKFDAHWESRCAYAGVHIHVCVERIIYLISNKRSKRNSQGYRKKHFKIQFVVLLKIKALLYEVGLFLAGVIQPMPLISILINWTGSVRFLWPTNITILLHYYYHILFLKSFYTIYASSIL